MRLIDADKAISDYTHYGISHPYDAYDLEDILNECLTIEAIPKDQYEARLKADMVAMLKDLDLQIEESAAYNIRVAKVQRLIRDKINTLKENKE